MRIDRQQRLDDGEHLGCDRLLRLRGVHHAAAKRFALGDVEEGFAALLMRLQLFLLETVRAAAPPAPRLRARSGRRRREDRR